MPTDPALAHQPSADQFMSIDDLVVDADSIYIFDFDGVIASSLEDQIYKLAPREGETAIFREVENRIGVRYEGLEHRYRRHIVFQAAAWFLRERINPGPGFHKARIACENASFFVLTARSGWYAVARQRLFLSQRRMLPIDIYNVGRATKTAQIEFLAQNDYRSKNIFYIEDSTTHLKAVEELNFHNVTPVFGGNRNEEKRLEEVAEYYYKGVIDRFLEKGPKDELRRHGGKLRTKEDFRELL